MDISLTADWVVRMLVPYLSAAGEIAAKEAIGRLYKFIEKKFTGDKPAETSLADMKKNPRDQDTQASLRKEIKKAMSADQEFALALVELMSEMDKENNAQTVNNTVITGEHSKTSGGIHIKNNLRRG